MASQTHKILHPPPDTLNTFLERFPEQTIVPASAQYKEFEYSFWSGTQCGCRPLCIFRPRTAQQLAQGLQLCSSINCRFAVRSGGHMHNAGFSSIDDGVQFDLGSLDTISIDKTKSTVRVGSGSRWCFVYEALQKEDVMAVGGRAAPVGVGGFLLGGGISFQAAERGWALDNVRSFEVALVDGTVITASTSSHPKLFRALRGGGSNFGVVASFELELFPYHGIWGGRTTSSVEHVSYAVNAFLDFIPNFGIDNNNKCHIFLTVTNEGGPMELIQHMVYTAPSKDLSVSVPALDHLREIPCHESDWGFTDHLSMAKRIGGFQEGNERRHMLSTTTFRPDRGLLDFAYRVFEQEATKISAMARGTFEVHFVPRAAKDDSWTVRGQSEKHGTLICIAIGFSTLEEIHDDLIIATQKDILQKIDTRAKQSGLYHPFLFMNYAGGFQDVIGSYGEENVQFLKGVASTYDQDGVFTRLMQGGFKLPS